MIIGDIILDRYVTGSVHRLSPEAPIPVLRPADNRCTLGGAANVALNVATLGGQAILVGVIGNDTAGDEVERLVQATPGIASALVAAIGVLFLSREYPAEPPDPNLETAPTEPLVRAH